MGIDEETNKAKDKVVQVKWDPFSGDKYAVLYEKKLEIYKANEDQPIATVTSDDELVSMEFISETEIVTADHEGKFTLVKGI